MLSDSADTVKVSWLVGVKYLEPITYEVKADRIAGIPWRYWLETQFLRMGPFYSKPRGKRNEGASVVVPVLTNPRHERLQK